MALHHAASAEIVSLQTLDNSAAHSIALVRTPLFETMQIILREHKAIGQHSFPAAVSFFTLEGNARVTLDGEERVLAAGQWLYLDPGTAFGLTGSPDASILMTIMFDTSVPDHAHAHRILNAAPS